VSRFLTWLTERLHNIGKGRVTAANQPTNHWDRFDLDFPADFPTASVDSLHAYLSDRDPAASETTEWKEWANGLNGVVYRFLGCDLEGASAIASLRASQSPPAPERLQQETALFRFFYEGLSCLECLYYALFFVGCLADPSSFNAGINRRDVVPHRVTRCFIKRFANDLLTHRLDGVLNHPDFSEWSDIRNFLSHRGAAGRTFYAGGATHGRVDWNLPIQNIDVSKLLDPDELQRRRDWLGVSVTEVMAAADAFAHNHVP
jgi:hypothetical protein